MLTRQLNWSFGSRKPQRFMGIEVAEIDGLGDVRIGLRPVLADLVHQPRHQFELTLAQKFGGAEEQSDALIPGGAAPAFKGLERRLHCWFDVFFAGLLMNSYNLRGPCRIERRNLICCPHAAAANNQVVLAAELAVNAVESATHFSGNLATAEISCGFIVKDRFMCMNMRMCRSFKSSHRRTSDRKLNFTRQI